MRPSVTSHADSWSTCAATLSPTPWPRRGRIDRDSRPCSTRLRTPRFRASTQALHDKDVRQPQGCRVGEAASIARGEHVERCCARGYLCANHSNEIAATGRNVTAEHASDSVALFHHEQETAIHAPGRDVSRLGSAWKRLPRVVVH